MGDKVLLLMQIFVIWLAIPGEVFCDLQTPPVMNPSLLSQTKTLGECKACRAFVDSFKKGLERTSRGKYEGGDAAWEEEKLKKSYKRSEMRLVDIQEGICKDQAPYTVQCHSVAEKAEEFIEEWWAQNPDESTDLYSTICIENLKVCCPKHHYGKTCTPCPGDHDKLCSGNGICRGDGTRKGNGTCLCDPGYVGDNCDECQSGYYLSYKDDNKLICSQCHKSCMGGCRHGTQKDCVACKPGFIFNTDEGCLDVNECHDVYRCQRDEYCLNSIGSYKCMKCDKSCDGCHGDGPDLCRKCAKGYVKTDDICVREGAQDVDMDPLSNIRFMVYAGLLITTLIVLPKSTSLGSMIGAAVLTYILVAEYYCMINGHKGLVDLKDYDLMRMFHT